MKLRSVPAVTCAALAGAAVLAAAASAVHWPSYGGDSGRSGHQPRDPGGLPVSYLWTAAGEGPVLTSPVITGGGSSARVAYGTDRATLTPTGRVQVRSVASGSAAGPTRGVAVDDNADDGDTFTGFTGASVPRPNLTPQGVAFADSSSDGSLGQLFVVHNDDNQDAGNDIAIAQVSESSGDRVQDFAVPGTDGYTISSSPLLAATDRAHDLFFVAVRSAGGAALPDARLFKVQIGNADSESAFFGQVSSQPVLGASPFASPTLVSLRDSGGHPVQYVAVSTAATPDALSTSSVQTFLRADITRAGPKSGDLGDDAQTVSVPVTSSGSEAEVSQALYVAVGQTAGGMPNAATKVYRLAHANGSADLTIADQSVVLGGRPAAGLAVARVADGPPGRVLVTTGGNLFSLDSSDLSNGERLAFNDELIAGSSGFSRTTVAASGALAYVARDGGTQLVLRVSDAKPAGFNQHFGNDDSRFSQGQPAISQRFVAFGSSLGLFVYRGAGSGGEGDGGGGGGGGGGTASGYYVNDVTVIEGDDGTHAARFTIAHVGGGAGSVEVSTEDGTAKAGEDYVEIDERTVSFGGGESTETVDVTIKGDTQAEPDESFTVKLSKSRGGNRTIVDSTGTGTIADDDGQTGSQPRLAVLDVSSSEAEGKAAFELKLTSAAAGKVSVEYATADDTAKAGSDYELATGTVTFGAGQTSRTVNVPVLDDTAAEATERFLMNLSKVKGAVLADGQGAAIIMDNDGGRPGGARLSSRGLSLTVSPRRDTRPPLRFTFSGALSLPRGLTRARACNGRISVLVRAGRRTVARRRQPLTSRCRYRVRAGFRTRARVGRARNLRVSARFLGNAVLEPAAATPRRVRIR